MRVIGENEFKNYPKLELEKQKVLFLQLINSSTIIINILFDWKYIDLGSFISYVSKVRADVTKQLCYESTLQLSNPNRRTKSLFVIPWFYNETAKDIGGCVDSKILYSRLTENKIEVLKANFLEIQQIYLTHD